MLRKVMPMTNRDLLKRPKELLSELNKQRQYLLRVGGTPMPCPACKKSCNVFEAAGIDLDSYDFGATELSYRCPHCSAELEQVVPLFPAFGHVWHWHLKESWLREQLRKARAFDQQARSPDSGEKP
jgi:hypothetical protein